MPKTILLVLAALIYPSSSFSPLLMKIGLASNILNSPNSDQDMYDAEEFAAYDAHDAPDAGLEAAAMERAVMMAEEMRKTHHIKGKICMVPTGETKLQSTKETFVSIVLYIIARKLVNCKNNNCVIYYRVMERFSKRRKQQHLMRTIYQTPPLKVQPWNER